MVLKRGRSRLRCKVLKVRFISTFGGFGFFSPFLEYKQYDSQYFREGVETKEVLVVLRSNTSAFLSLSSFNHLVRVRNKKNYNFAV